MDIPTRNQLDSQLAYVQRLVEDSTGKAEPDYARVSIALGAFEALFTDTKQAEVLDIQAECELCGAAFAAFAEDAVTKLAPELTTQAKVKVLANLVWSRLTGVFTKDIHHAQHVYTFARILRAGKQHKGKRQLDCAGLVTTVLALCQQLARREAFADLAACRFQVSEDHCWINTDPAGSREGSIEVTTDTVAKRGFPVAEDAWQGWLYTGGHAVLCSPQVFGFRAKVREAQMFVTAMVTSVNPGIDMRQTSGSDSEEVQLLQRRLLEYMRKVHPEHMYPAGLCCLADLHEIQEQDVLDTKHDCGSTVVVPLRFNGAKDDAQAMFREAIEMTRSRYDDWQFYPYRANFCLECDKKVRPEREARLEQGAANNWTVAQIRSNAQIWSALEWCGAQGAAAVLAKYQNRYAKTDEQLHKDVEGLLEAVQEALAALAKLNGGPLEERTPPFEFLLELWDGVCLWNSGRPQPAHWTAAVLKAAKAFSEAARCKGAMSAQTKSGPMEKARELWGPLKPAQLRPLFETADVAAGSERGAKRPRR